MHTEFRDADNAEAYPPGYELHYWHRARSDVVRRLVRSVCQTGDTILEIGAARGHYVRVLRSEGYDAFGCDLGTASVHEEVQAFVFRGRDFADLEPTLRERVTTVLLLDVVEHIEKPSDFIVSVFRSLPAVQSMIITVPARPELWSNYDEHFRHYVRYDIRSLCELAERSGLSVDTYGYFFHALYAPAWLLKKIGINRRTSFAIPKILWLHKLLGIALSLESRLLPKTVCGTSLACICRPLVGK